MSICIYIVYNVPDSTIQSSIYSFYIDNQMQIQDWWCSFVLLYSTLFSPTRKKGFIKDSSSLCKVFVHFYNMLSLLGLYQTSRPVRKSGKLSKSGLSGNQMFSFPERHKILAWRFGHEKGIRRHMDKGVTSRCRITNKDCRLHTGFPINKSLFSVINRSNLGDCLVGHTNFLIPNCLHNGILTIIRQN